MANLYIPPEPVFTQSDEQINSDTCMPSVLNDNPINQTKLENLPNPSPDPYDNLYIPITTSKYAGIFCSSLLFACPFIFWVSNQSSLSPDTSKSKIFAFLTFQIIWAIINIIRNITNTRSFFEFGSNKKERACSLLAICAYLIKLGIGIDVSHKYLYPSLLIETFIGHYLIYEFISLVIYGLILFIGSIRVNPEYIGDKSTKIINSIGFCILLTFWVTTLLGLYVNPDWIYVDTSSDVSTKNYSLYTIQLTEYSLCAIAQLLVTYRTWKFNDTHTYTNYSQYVFIVCLGSIQFIIWAGSHSVNIDEFNTIPILIRIGTGFNFLVFIITCIIFGVYIIFWIGLICIALVSYPEYALSVLVCNCVPILDKLSGSRSSRNDSSDDIESKG